MHIRLTEEISIDKPRYSSECKINIMHNEINVHKQRQIYIINTNIARALDEERIPRVFIFMTNYIIIEEQRQER